MQPITIVAFKQEKVVGFILTPQNRLNSVKFLYLCDQNLRSGKGKICSNKPYSPNMPFH